MSVNAFNSDNSQIISVYPEEIDFFEKFLDKKNIYWNEKHKENHVIAFSNSLTGYIGTPKRRIVLHPKYREITISHIIRLYNYVYSYNDKEDDELLDITESSRDIVKSFFEKLQEQLLIGILQDYSIFKKNIHFIKGKVDFIKTYTNSLLQKNLPVSTEVFQLSVDLPINRLIVGALNKISLSNEHFSQSIELLGYFEGVVPIEENASEFLSNINFTSKDFRYKKVAIEAAMIIDSLFYDATEGSLGGESFLINFDRLFEDFISKILLEEVEEHDFTTWKEKKSFAKIYSQGHTSGIKYYQPDLLYKYNPENELYNYEPSAQAVLDVKNKAYSIFNNADVYQIMFYNQLLYTKKNILIYPSFSYKKSLSLFIENDKLPVPYVYSIFINIKEKEADGFKRSIRQFIVDLYDCLDYQDE